MLKHGTRLAIERGATFRNVAYERACYFRNKHRYLAKQPWCSCGRLEAHKSLILAGFWYRIPFVCRVSLNMTFRYNDKDVTTEMEMVV